jgi:acyl carrier protein
MPGAKTLEEIESFLVQYVSVRAEIGAASVDKRRAFDTYGLDSADAIELVGQLEDFLGRPLHASLPYTHPNIAALASHLVGGAG